MAKLKIARTRGSVVSKKPKKKPKKQIKVSIPTKPSQVIVDIRRYSILLHGEKKIGKTTLFAQEKKAFFMQFDPLQLSLAIRQRHIPDWPHFLAYIDLLEGGDENVETAIVDGADIAYQHCFDWCCMKLAITHPHDENDYGKSWKFIRSEFEKAVLRLLSLNEKGIATRFICHSKWAEIKTRGGGKTEKLVTYLTSQAEEVLNGRIDIWAAYTYFDKKRILIIEGDEEIGAGHRVDGRFLTLEGEAIKEIDMGRSAKQAYENLLEAFNNEQVYSVIEEAVPVKKKKKLKVRIRK